MNQITKIFGKKPANVIVPSLLFGLLSPNILVNARLLKVYQPVMSKKLGDVVIHAFVFALIYTLLRRQFPQFY